MRFRFPRVGRTDDSRSSIHLGTVPYTHRPIAHLQIRTDLQFLSASSPFKELHRICGCGESEVIQIRLAIMVDGARSLIWSLISPTWVHDSQSSRNKERTDQLIFPESAVSRLTASFCTCRHDGLCDPRFCSWQKRLGEFASRRYLKKSCQPARIPHEIDLRRCTNLVASGD